MKLTFLGAAETVTGSKYLVTVDRKNILVDCGLFQGYKELRLRNREKFPIDPACIDAVILTHAHIDHSGYIPVLVKNGFKGKVFCTQATKDLCSILLPDSGHLQEEEAVFANKRGYSKHKPALPLYTVQDAEIALQQLQACDFAKAYSLFDGFTFQFNRAGHILGAATVFIKHDNRSLLFSGDLGRPHDLVMKPPVAVTAADYLVIESTYGAGQHEASNPIDELEIIINRTIKRNGSLIIPAFAVGRAQNILYFIQQLISTKRIPVVGVFLDSPMAISATELFCHYTHEHQLTPQQCRLIDNITTYVRTQEISKELDSDVTPKIILSASGMATGGRVLHHIKAYAANPRNTILFTGFQAAGTLGDRLVRGEREVKVLGETVQVNAEVIQLHNTSAHVDSEEMLQWLQKFQSAPRKVFITHGEPAAARALKFKIENALGWDCEVPKYLQVVEL